MLWPIEHGEYGDPGVRSRHAQRRAEFFRRFGHARQRISQIDLDTLAMSILNMQTSGVELTKSSFFSMTRKGDALIVRPTGPRMGESDAGIIAPEVKAALKEAGSAIQELVLDLSQVKVTSSYGLGLCIELRNFARTCGAQTVIRGVCPDIRELFRIMKLDRLFTICLNNLAAPSAAAA